MLQNGNKNEQPLWSGSLGKGFSGCLGPEAIIAFLISDFTIMVGESSFLLASDLSLVVSEFFVSQMLTSTSWGIDSVSRMLTSCSFALDVSGCLSYFSPPSLSLLCSALIIFFHIKLHSTRVYNVVTSKPKKFNKI